GASTSLAKTSCALEPSEKPASSRPTESASARRSSMVRGGAATACSGMAPFLLPGDRDQPIPNFEASCLVRFIVDSPLDLVSPDTEDGAGQSILDVAVGRVGAVDRQLGISRVPQYAERAALWVRLRRLPKQQLAA